MHNGQNICWRQNENPNNAGTWFRLQKRCCQIYRKKWKLDSIKAICKRIDMWGLAANRKPGSRRPKTAQTVENVECVAELISSQEDKPATIESTRIIVKELKVSERSVRQMAKEDLGLSPFHRIAAQVISDATKQKQLVRCRQPSRRLTVEDVKRVFFNDEKVFYTNPPINSQNDRVWSQGKKSDVVASRLLVQRAKFAPHIMVSAGVSFERKGRLHFVEEKAKIKPTVTLTICCRSWETLLYSSRMVHWHMGRWERKSGLANIGLHC